MKYIYLDIETIPDGDKLDPSEIKGDARLKDPIKIKSDLAKKQDDEFRKRSLVSYKGRILCLSYAINDSDIKTIRGTDREIIEEFASDMMQAINQTRDGYCFVGHNISEFDMPWILQRAYKYSEKGLAAMIPMSKYETSIDDTMIMFNGTSRNTVSLDNMCKFFGFEGKGDIDGSMVYDMYLDGKIDEICKYCEEDVDKLRKCHKMMSF